jgi:ribosome-binding protein aMBF1 (putative translation factor)
MLYFSSAEAGMAQTQLATRIDARVKKAVERVCDARGLKMNRFIEDALIDKLEELEDIEDLKKIRGEPTRPLSDLLKDLKLDGKL